MRALAIFTILFLLTGCASAPDLVAVCGPAPKTYSQAQQFAASTELLALPASSVIAQMMTDYAAERAALRACSKTKP